MTKAQLVARLAEGTGASRKQIDEILASIIDAVVVPRARTVPAAQAVSRVRPRVASSGYDGHGSTYALRARNELPRPDQTVHRHHTGHRPAAPRQHLSRRLPEVRLQAVHDQARQQLRLAQRAGRVRAVRAGGRPAYLRS